MDLTFLGGVGTVTGSRTLLQAGGTRLLVDCGLFQGFKHLRLLNRRPIPVDPRDLDGVVLTHAHLDHSGAIPLLVRQGYAGPVYGTPGTAALCHVLWEDAAGLQEEDAERANRKHYSRHARAEPLFDTADAVRAEGHLHGLEWGVRRRIGRAEVTLRRAGHILGASSALVEVDGHRVLFSGDLGRPSDPLHGGPDRLPAVDTVVIEGTYGDRVHGPDDVEEQIARVVCRTAGRGGMVLIPVFAVGRAQRVLHHLARLRAAGDIPELPIYLDSPMADEAMEVFTAHPDAHLLTPGDVQRMVRTPHIVRDKAASKALNARTAPAIILAGSGMVAGGRILHHLLAHGGDARNTILLTGYQAGGTRGDRLLRGEREIKIFGQMVPIGAEVVRLDSVSAHADSDDLIAWLRDAEALPGRVLINHAEPLAADALRARVEHELRLPCAVPLHGEVVPL